MFALCSSNRKVALKNSYLIYLTATNKLCGRDLYNMINVHAKTHGKKQSLGHNNGFHLYIKIYLYVFW